MSHDEKSFIRDNLINEGVSKEATRFYIFFVALFTSDIPMNNTTNKLADMYGKSERTIRRYIKELSEKFHYIRIQPKWNNDNIAKPFREYNIYHLLDESKTLLKKAKSFSQRDENVNFVTRTI